MRRASCATLLAALIPFIFVAGLLLGWSGLLPNPLSRQPAGVQRTFGPF